MNSWTALLTHSLQHAPLVAIGGVYAWRVTNPKSPEEKEQMIKAADFAFRQAYALCPKVQKPISGMRTYWSASSV